VAGDGRVRIIDVILFIGVTGLVNGACGIRVLHSYQAVTAPAAIVGNAIHSSVIASYEFLDGNLFFLTVG
jgi:hypothetical protein